MTAPDLLAERFTLRAPRDSDAEFYAQTTSDTETQRWRPGVGLRQGWLDGIGQQHCLPAAG